MTGCILLIMLIPPTVQKPVFGDKRIGDSKLTLKKSVLYGSPAMRCI